MTTLIIVGTSSGETGRCDAKCYNSVFKRCVCCCGGVNHGVGKVKAIVNTQELGKNHILAACIANNIPAEIVTFAHGINQTDLFEKGE